MKSLIILNPASYQGKALLYREELEAALKELALSHDIVLSKSSADITDTVRKNIDNYTNFISVGGDGTLHHMANTLAGTDKNLGCIPFGSGNDIATSLGITADIKKCCLSIKQCRTKKIDLGLINKKYYYLGVSGAGFDSVVTDLANNTRFPFKGPSKYKYAIYKTIITFTSKKFYIKYNGIVKTVDSMFMVVGNTDRYGGGMRIVPDADPFDSILDVCIIKRMNKIHFIKTFPLVFEGLHTTDPFVEYFKVKNIEIDSEYKFSVFADGEYICKLPASYELAPEALNFIMPGD